MLLKGPVTNSLLAFLYHFEHFSALKLCIVAGVENTMLRDWKGLLKGHLPTLHRQAAGSSEVHGNLR